MNLIEKYINPFTDFGFKKLFGTEPNKELLIDFLNQVVLPKHQNVSDLTYSRNEQMGVSEIDRKAIFDLYCIGTSGERFIVEIQKAKQNYFKDRSVFYSTFPIQEQAKRGNWDFKLSEVYTVGILDFVFSEDSLDKKVRHVVKLKDQNGNIFYDKLTLVYLELPNFNKTEEELETPYDKWLFVLKHLPDLERRPTKLQERIFEKLFAAAEIAKFSKTEQEEYEASLKYYRDLKNVIDTAFDEGEAKGKMEGKMEMALKALDEGISISIISKLTGLSEEEIDKLKNKN
jgi:predicted transposase/invertase (TIGR01784 family)